MDWQDVTNLKQKGEERGGGELSHSRFNVSSPTFGWIIKTQTNIEYFYCLFKC